MIARELLVKLGFDIDAAKLDKFSDMVEDTKRKMQALKQDMTPEIVSRFRELKAEHDEQQTWSREERADVKALNRLEKQAIKEVTDLEKEQFKEKQRQLKELKTSAQNISRKIAMFGAGIAAGFGLSLRATLNDAEAFKKGKSKSNFTPQQIAEVNRFNKALESTKQVTVDIRNSFITDMLPAINKVLVPFRKWLEANKAIIKEKLITTFKTLGTVMVGIAKAVTIVVKAFGGFARILSVVKLAIAGVGIFKLSQGLLSTWQNIKLINAALKGGWFSTFLKTGIKSLLSPVTLIAAGLTGLLLILEDLYVFSKGGDSLIGDILNSEAVKKFTDMINNLLKALGLLEEKQQKVIRGTGKGLEVTKIEDNTRGYFKNQRRQVTMGLPEEYKARIDNIRNVMTELNLPTKFPVAERSPVINSSPTFNMAMTINVPTGTTQDQARTITDRVKEELEKHQEKLLNAIGAH